MCIWGLTNSFCDCMLLENCKLLEISPVSSNSNLGTLVFYGERLESYKGGRECFWGGRSGY